MKLIKGDFIYVVTAYRWGERENHSYNVGVFSKERDAIKCADSHCNYRGGKYACVVDRCCLDLYVDECRSYTTETYRAKSIMG